MAYADNRIIIWSNEPLGDDAVEFANGNELDAACKNGLEDYAETLKHREEWRSSIKELEGGE